MKKLPELLKSSHYRILFDPVFGGCDNGLPDAEMIVPVNDRRMVHKMPTLSRLQIKKKVALIE